MSLLASAGAEVENLPHAVQAYDRQGKAPSRYFREALSPVTYVDVFCPFRKLVVKVTGAPRSCNIKPASSPDIAKPGHIRQYNTEFVTTW